MVSIQFVRQSDAISTVSIPVSQPTDEDHSSAQETKVSLTSWLSDDCSSDYPQAVQQYRSKFQTIT